MSNSQNKKSEQQNNLCTTLTEQWKKGELEQGWYYTQTGRFEEVGLDLYDKDVDDWMCNSDKDLPPFKILAKIPSYEEWRDLQEYKRIVNSYNMKPIDYDIACETVNKLLDEKEKLRNELGLLKESIGKDCGTYYTNLFLQENKQLKVLLRECEESVLFEAKVVKETSGKDSTAYKILTRILTKIDNVIGEKK